MSPMNSLAPASSFPRPGVVLELLKPVTWFAPMWAYMCGVVSSGAPLSTRWGALLAGMVLAGPLVCAASQAANDWYDRHVDALNEPDRPIPSGRLPGRWGLWIAIAWTGLALALGAILGPWALAGTAVGLVLAWIYSAPPLRLKLNGWWGNAAVGLSYEGLAWFTGAAVMLSALPGPGVIALALAYSIGAHGIMTLNDFKAIDGDRQMGVRSLPVQLGPERAARLACWVMAVPQAGVIAGLFAIGRPVHAAIIAALLIAQLAFMRVMLRDPRRLAPWYNGTGVLAFVLGMLVAALAIRSIPELLAW
jgi:chlorophyll synthase